MRFSSAVSVFRPYLFAKPKQIRAFRQDICLSLSLLFTFRYHHAPCFLLCSLPLLSLFFRFSLLVLHLSSLSVSSPISLLSSLAPLPAERLLLRAPTWQQNASVLHLLNCRTHPFCSYPWQQNATVSSSCLFLVCVFPFVLSPLMPVLPISFDNTGCVCVQTALPRRFHSQCMAA